MYLQFIRVLFIVSMLQEALALVAKWTGDLEVQGVAYSPPDAPQSRPNVTAERAEFCLF